MLQVRAWQRPDFRQSQEKLIFLSSLQLIHQIAGICAMVTPRGFMSTEGGVACAYRSLVLKNSRTRGGGIILSPDIGALWSFSPM